MTWYNFKHDWINLDHCYGIRIYNEKIRFVFPGYNGDTSEIYFRNNEERDAEFAKIKLLMGIEDYTSRCC